MTLAVIITNITLTIALGLVGVALLAEMTKNSRPIVFDSKSPDIIKLRKEFKEEFGSTELFDYFYINLRNRIAKDTMKAMIDGQEFGKLIHEKLKARVEAVE